WESKNVQGNKNEYEKYKELMTEFYIGSHMLFEERDEGSILSELETKIKKGIEERYSSHYKPVGTERHHHVRARQHPEILFHKGTFLHGQPGKYAPDSSKDENQFKAFWIQTERTPDGPNFLSMLKHRMVDYVQYFFLKHVLNSERPQISSYIGPN